jgi:hypothetical protein
VYFFVCRGEDFRFRKLNSNSGGDFTYNSLFSFLMGNMFFQTCHILTSPWVELLASFVGLVGWLKS